MFLLDSSKWKVKKTKWKGRGVFATQEIEAGVVIGDYIGKVLRPDQDPDEDGIYSMELGDKAIIAPHVDSIGVHVINHSCMPNCALYPYEGHMLYVSLRVIFPGEELTVNYFISPTGEDDESVLMCSCGSPLCRGTMYVSSEREEAFVAFIERMQGSKYNMKLPLYKDLPPLSVYPSHVEDNPIYDLFGSTDQAPVFYDGSTLPSQGEIRRQIRQTGKQIVCKKLHCTILGILEGHVVYKDTIPKSK
jgi:hypothetical protein